MQAGCLEIEERKKEIFFFSVADQNFKGGEGMLMQLGRDGLTQCLRLFKIPDKTLEIPMQQILQDIGKKKICFSFYSIILSVYLLRLYQSLNYQVL